MSVKHVSASKTPGLLGTSKRRPLNLAAARPAQKSAVVPGESKALAESGVEVTQAPPGDPRITAEGALTDTDSEIATPQHAAPSEAADAAAELLDVVAPAPAAPASAAVDYYAIITRTIEGLALNNVETRAEVYERARRVVEERLEQAGPAMTSHMVAVERTAFDRAILKIEAEQLDLAFSRTASGAGKTDRQAFVIDADAAETADAAATTPAPPQETETAAVSQHPPLQQQSPPQTIAPSIVVNRRSRPAPPLRQTHGGTLRLFALVGLILAGGAAYWLATGRPDLTGPLSHIVAKPQPPQAENVTASMPAAATEPPAANVAAQPETQAEAGPAAPEASPAPANDDIDVTSPNAYNIQLATFLSLCRPAQTAYGEDPCGNLQPRPFGGPGVTPRNAVEWIPLYASLSEIPMHRVKKPAFTMPVSQASAAPSGDIPVAATAGRTGSAAARERFERGMDLAQNDSLEAAIADFSEAIRLDPQFADAYVQRGQTLFKNGNVDRAIADFTKALQIDPRHIAAFKARGMAMLYKGDDDAAISDLTKAIQYAELDVAAAPPVEVFFARRSRATLYNRKQLYERELADLTAMIDGYWRDPGLAAALRNTYRDQGAAALMASIYRLRAGVNQKRANLDAAIGDLSLALQLDSQRTLQYLIERGRLLEAAGRREQAIADYQQALELSPNNTDVKNSLTRLKGRT